MCAEKAARPAMTDVQTSPRQRLSYPWSPQWTGEQQPTFWDNQRLAVHRSLSFPQGLRRGCSGNREERRKVMVRALLVEGNDTLFTVNFIIRIMYVDV